MWAGAVPSCPAGLSPPPGAYGGAEAAAEWSRVVPWPAGGGSGLAQVSAGGICAGSGMCLRGQVCKRTGEETTGAVQRGGAGQYGRYESRLGRAWGVPGLGPSCFLLGCDSIEKHFN